MKKIFFLQLFLAGFISILNAQDNKPEYLKYPESWEFERFSIPPGFAPFLPYKGVEELRFAPGFFNKDSVNYFTYAFVSRMDSTTEFSQQSLYEYLLAYYKGLALASGADRKLTTYHLTQLPRSPSSLFHQ